MYSLKLWRDIQSKLELLRQVSPPAPPAMKHGNGQAMVKIPLVVWAEWIHLDKAR